MKYLITLALMLSCMVSEAQLFVKLDAGSTLKGYAAAKVEAQAELKMLSLSGGYTRLLTDNVTKPDYIYVKIGFILPLGDNVNVNATYTRYYKYWREEEFHGIYSHYAYRSKYGSGMSLQVNYKIYKESYFYIGGDYVGDTFLMVGVKTSICRQN